MLLAGTSHRLWRSDSGFSYLPCIWPPAPLPPLAASAGGEMSLEREYVQPRNRLAEITTPWTGLLPYWNLIPLKNSRSSDTQPLQHRPIPTICHHTANNHYPSKAIGHTSTTRFKDVGKVAKRLPPKIGTLHTTPVTCTFKILEIYPDKVLQLFRHLPHRSATFPTFRPPWNGALSPREPLYTHPPRQSQHTHPPCEPPYARPRRRPLTTTHRANLYEK